MSITVTSDLADISACNTTADGGTHYKLNGTNSANPGQDGDAHVQGSACIANKMGTTVAPNDVGGHFNATVPFDLTGKHLFHWRQIVTAGNMETRANRGVCIGLTSTSTTSQTSWSSTDYKLWYLDGRDTAPLAQGWVPYVLDPTSTPDASAGTLTISSVKNVGMICRQTSSVTATVSNQFYDAIRMGTGMTAVASSAADTINFASLYAQDSNLANAWGIVTKIGGVYFGGAKISVGSTGQTNTCLFKDTNAVLVWRSAKVASDLYALKLNGASGFPTTLQLGEKNGSGNTSDGCVVRGEGAAVWSIVCDAFSVFKAYSSALASILTGVLSGTSELKNTAISNSGTLDVNGATIAGCSFSAHTATQLKVDSPGEMALVTTSGFTSGGTGHAIEITAPGTYTFNGLAFNGYAASNGSTGQEAVYNNSGGAVTINVSGGGSTPSYRNGAGASTTVNNSVTLTLTGLQTGSDIVILAAGTSTILAQVDQNAGSTFPYSFTTGGAVDIGVLKAGYVPQYLRNFQLPAANTSLPISQVADRNYS